jgi:hypothetical protein
MLLKKEEITRYIADAVSNLNELHHADTRYFLIIIILYL